MNHTIALLITYYNEKELFTECMQSVAAQTVAPDEVLIYDDCSPFPAKEYIPASFSLPYRIIRGAINNGSPAIGRNILMQEAKSNYLHFHDGDDLLKPNCIEKIKEAIQQNDYDVIINNVELKDTHHISPFMNVEKIKKLGIFVFGITHCYITHSVTFKKTLGLSIEGFWGNDVLTASEDYEFFARMTYVAKSYHIIEEELVTYIIYPQSRNRDVINWALATLKAVDLLVAHLPKQYHHILARRANECAYQLYLEQAYQKSKQACIYADTIHKNAFGDFPLLYQYIGKITGLYNTFRLSTIYQHILPQKTRQFIKKLVSSKTE